MAFYFEVGAILVSVFLVYLLLKFFFKPAQIIANSILGIVIFFVLNFIFNIGIPFTWLSVGVVAISGILGVILVLLLHVTGLGF
jgi:hypothetical protein